MIFNKYFNNYTKSRENYQGKLKYDDNAEERNVTMILQ